MSDQRKAPTKHIDGFWKTQKRTEKERRAELLKRQQEQRRFRSCIINTNSIFLTSDTEGVAS